MSLFQGEGYPLPLKPELRILVLGRGEPAEKAAQAVIRAGGRPVQAPGPMTGISGMPGNFKAVFETGQGTKTVTLGGVVLAYPPLAGEAGGALPGLETGLPQGDEDWAGVKVALLTGFWNQSGPAAFGRVLDLGLKILEQGGNPYLFAPQAKVAGDGVEDKYRRFREEGGLVTRIQDPPRLDPAGDKTRAVFRDPILTQDVGVTLDRVILDPPLGAPGELAGAIAVLGLEGGPDGWPAPDNVLFPAPLTSRAGVFALGGGTGPESLDLEAEADLLAEQIRRLFNPEGGIRSAARTASDKRQCAVCLTCLRTCPVQAIGWDKGPVVMESACLNCGQCAAVCPAAIIKPLWPEEETLQELLAQPGQGNLVLACGRIEEEALTGLPQGAKAVRVSCAGRVGMELLLRLLSLGYERVLVAACHPGNCRSLSGSQRAGRVVEAVRAELKELDLDPGAVAYVPLAPHQGGRLLAALG